MKADPSKFPRAASMVVFFMMFVMLFLIPLSQFLVGCQALHNTERSATSDQRVDSLRRLSATKAPFEIREVEVGGQGGEVIGRHMDSHAVALKQVLGGANVVRTGEAILITFDSQGLFKDDCTDIYSVAKSKLKNLAKVLDTCQYTNARIEVHTDDTAEESYNYFLSCKRAVSIENYLVSQGIENTRLKSRGYGEKQPIATNETDDGKRANKRVEIAVYANLRMRKMALSGALGDYIALKK